MGSIARVEYICGFSMGVQQGKKSYKTKGHGHSLAGEQQEEHTIINSCGAVCVIPLLLLY